MAGGQLVFIILAELCIFVVFDAHEASPVHGCTYENLIKTCLFPLKIQYAGYETK